jgi:ATP-dependent Lhr-like helicase
MRRAGTAVFVHHSAVSREERQIAEAQFHHGTDACIVCTSTLELGIDVGDLDRVLQAEAPDTVSSFLQRMGRTGRREGQTANTSFFCESSEGVLQAAALVELAKSGWVESVALDHRCWPVLIHQVLAMSLARDGIGADDAWSHLSRVPDFTGIHRAEFDRLLNWMLRDGALRLASGRLVLGAKAERRFGRRNFMELFAVFSSPQSYTVQAVEGQPLGTLTQAFVDRLVEGVSSFLLAGRSWFVARVQHDDRRVVVQPAPRGRQPTWGGFLPQFLGYEVCQRILALLRSDHPLSYLDASASTELDQQRASMRAVLTSERGGLEFADGEIRWWTFAGGRINSTLRYALEALGGSWKVVADNFLIRIRGQAVTRARFDEGLTRLGEIEFWEDQQLWARVAQSLPTYRLSKFQPLMPPWVEREVVAGYLLDIAQTWRWLSGADGDLSRVPEAVRAVTSADEARLARLPMALDLPRLTRDPSRPIVWVRSDAELAKSIGSLMEEVMVGLDVETTLTTGTLCLVQIAGATSTHLIDVLELTDLSPLAPLLTNGRVTKVIHNAVFEREVLARHGLALEGVVDTCDASRRLRGDVDGGHSLRAVCARELQRDVDKTEQTSDWARRPLSGRQVDYAALDAEVLRELAPRLARDVPSRAG